MKLSIIEPNYFKKFHCMGGGCKNTCCQQWSVYFTKKDYIDVRNTRKSKELQEICNSAFRRIKHNKDNSNNAYAHLVFDEKGFCPMLSEDGLCRLQVECGYKILPIVCKQFPRKNFIYLTSAEHYLSTGCEEVVRMLMNLPEGIELTGGGETDVTGTIQIDLAILKAEQAALTPYKYYWDVKTLIISIMKNRNYSVEDRLILLGIAFKRIDDLINSGKGDKIPAYVDGLTALCSDDKSMLDEIRSLEPKNHQKAINFGNILNALSAIQAWPTEFIEKEKSVYGFVYSFNEDGSRINIAFPNVNIEKQLGYLFNMLSGREYVLENFMLNAMLCLNLPFSDTSLSFWDSYLFICQVYNLMIFTIAGNLNENSNDDDIIDAMAIFSRILLHSNKLRETIITDIKNNNYTSLASMVYLIKF